MLDVKMQLFQISHQVQDFANCSRKVRLVGTLPVIQAAWGIHPAKAVRLASRFIVKDQDRRMSAGVVRKPPQNLR